MKVLNTFPPDSVYKLVHNTFKFDDERVLFTYADTLYNPSSVVVDEYFLAHEKTHSLQQLGGTAENPDEWWSRYCSDSLFRLEQEASAYNAQYTLFCKYHINFKKQYLYLSELAKVLISPMYGFDLSLSDAMSYIVNYPILNF